MKSQENCKSENPKATSRCSSKMKDPRIVGVSRAFGRKDRHSKVCTVKGLRDRRVRLSVPTAIQIYDLQDRLGLSQPSKVVDWLLNAAKKDIDELPPLQIPAGSFISQSLLAMLSSQSDKQGLKISGSNEGFGGTSQSHKLDESCWPYVSENSFGYRPNLSSYHNNSTNQVNASFMKWDSSDLSLSHPPRSCNGEQAQDWHNGSVLQPSIIYNNGIVTQTQSYFPPMGFGLESEPAREIHFNMTQVNEDTLQLHNKGQCFVHGECNEFK